MPVNLTRPSEHAEVSRIVSDRDADRLVELVFAAPRRFWRVAEEPLARHGLGAAHYRALASVRRAESQPVSSLRRRLGVRKQSLARVLAELEEWGFIARAAGAVDKRVRLIALTAKGRAAEREATNALRERAAVVFAAAGPEAVAAARLVLAMLAGEDHG